MVERYVFAKLVAAQATEAGRAEVRARAAVLADVPGITAVVIGRPADGAALHAWDLSLVLRFASPTDAARALAAPAYTQFHDDYLVPRAQVIKAWSFEV